MSLILHSGCKFGIRTIVSSEELYAITAVIYIDKGGQIHFILSCTNMVINL